jgi:hypothetical protein
VLNDSSELSIRTSIQASFAEETNDPLPRDWVDAIRNFVYHISSDQFSSEAIASYNNAVNIHPVTKQRSFAANAYYDARGNLHIIRSARGEKIVLNGPNAEVAASGVRRIK